MVKRVGGTFCAFVLIVLSCVAGSASAGNGNGNANGNGNGNGKSDAAPTEQPAAPGNSNEAPGQAKKDDAPQPDAKPTGQDKKSSAPAEQTAPAPSAPSDGVKPSNSTEKNTNAPAGSNRTKKYGNGKTAGQIAMQHGYPASGNVHGPGNSQPHKVVTCGHRHEVDVHALKSHPAKGCGSSTPPPTHTPDPPTVHEPPVSVTPHGSTATGATTVASSKKPVADPATKGGSGTDHGTAAVQTMTGVLATTAAVGGSTLPFTGFPLWAVAFVALTLIGAGLSLRRVA
jgi:hypothetical protein